jgi:branched-chain amino acid transport system permease protein
MTSGPSRGRTSRIPEAPAAPSADGELAGLRFRVRRYFSGPAAFALIYVLLGVYSLFGVGSYNQYEIALVLVFGIAALGQDLLMGRAGQISLGAAAFMAIGAYTTARLSVESWAPFPLPLIAAAVLGGVAGLIVGIAGLRFRGLYLILSTLVLQFVISFAGQEYQGSQEQGFTVNTASLPGIEFGQGRPIMVLLFVVLGLVTLAFAGLYRRAPGRAWSAIRQNETAAAIAGIDVLRWKLLAFVASSAVIAVAGSMYAYVTGLVSYIPFNLDLAVSILVMVFIGGIGSMAGALIGATIVTLLPVWFQQSTTGLSSAPGIASWLSTNGPTLSTALYGLALLLVLLFERDGLVGLARRSWRSASKLRQRRGES